MKSLCESKTGKIFFNLNGQGSFFTSPRNGFLFPLFLCISFLLDVRVRWKAVF